jgi:hypothetical protein
MMHYKSAGQRLPQQVVRLKAVHAVIWWSALPPQNPVQSSPDLPLSK